MERFKSEAVKVRYVDDLTIVFFNGESIYIHDKLQGWVVFHRWFAPRGSYVNSWRNFRRLLLREKHLTLSHCYRIAFAYDIPVQRAKAPDLSKVKIEERFN